MSAPGPTAASREPRRSLLTDAQRAALDALFEPVGRSDSPGLVVGIALHGTPVYRRGFGLASVQHGVANTPATRMRIASISKHFTSLACLLLVEEGKLDIDAPATRYLPELPILGRVPTLRQFMNHTSGYRCTLEMGTLANGLALQPRGWQMRALARQRGANFAAGERQTYCNGTYHALSEVIERVSGVAFESFLQDRIFTPLGMHDTESVPNPAQIVPGMAALHIRAPDGGWQSAPCESELRGDGGMISSVDDLLRWLAHLNGPKRVGSAESWRQLLEPATLTNGTRTVYSLGLKRNRYRGVEVIHHSGGLIGLQGQMLTAPECGLDVVILVNGAPVSATQLSWRVLDIVLADRLESPRVPAQASEHRHLLMRTYCGSSGLTLGFHESEDGRLSESLFQMHPAPLFFDEGTTLRAGFEDIGLGPYVLEKEALAADANGQPPRQLPISISGWTEVLHLLPKDPPAAADIADGVVGHYHSPDLAAHAEITLEGNRLVLLLQGDYSARRRLHLQTLSPLDFAALEEPPADGRYALAFDLQGATRGFWIDTYRARRIRFDRIGAREELPT